MYNESKRTSEKTNTIQEFTVQFWADRASVDSTTVAIGQVATDVLNLSDKLLFELRTKTEALLKELRTKLYNPSIKKDLAIITATQSKMNEVWDVLFALPLFRHMDLDRDYAKRLLHTAFEDYPEEFRKMINPATPEGAIFEGLIFKLVSTADELIAFRTYIGVLLDFYFERLKRRDAEHYAVGMYSFFSDTRTLNKIADALPDAPVFMLRQARSAMIEYVPMPDPEDTTKYVIAERMVFDSIGAFLHVDFFRGLSQGNAPRKCHNCSKFFLLTRGYNICYCNQIAPGETKRTCRIVGAHKKEARMEGKTPAQKEYAKVYNRLKTRRCRGKISTDEWNAAVALAQEHKDRAECGEMSELELKRVFGEM